MGGESLLAGVDFSPSSAAAVATAMRLADLLAARVEILHDSERGAAGAALPEAAGHYRAVTADSRHSFHVREGLPWLELLRRAEELRPLALVVGSHGRSGLNPLALGSTASKLVLVSPCPVMVVTARGGTVP